MATDYADIDIAPYIDHSLLSPTASPENVEQWCLEAEQYKFASVCVAPIHVLQAAELLHRKSPKVTTVIGFPTGATTSAVKLYEAEEAVNRGAQELDMVINLAWLKSGELELLHRELAEVCDATGVPVKAILETALLTEAEIQTAVDVCLDAGVTFLKTSTGWFGGATVEVVRLLKTLTRDRVGIKASGGIGSAEQALDLILAGATRLGTSRSLEILRQREMLDRPAD
jgi:deoxyribose-phosphate aldolase